MSSHASLRAPQRREGRARVAAREVDRPARPGRERAPAARSRSVGVELRELIARVARLAVLAGGEQ